MIKYIKSKKVLNQKNKTTAVFDEYRNYTSSIFLQKDILQILTQQSKLRYLDF